MNQGSLIEHSNIDHLHRCKFYLLNTVVYFGQITATIFRNLDELVKENRIINYLLVVLQHSVQSDMLCVDNREILVLSPIGLGLISKYRLHY